MKPQFVITANVTVSSKNGSFNQSGYPNCFIINLKNKISNINILGFTIKFENSNPCYGYMIADWCPIRKRLKLYDVDGYVAQMY
jgi:hypothetical protein